MRHPVLPEPEGGGAAAGHGAQAVVGVGHLQARGQPGEQRRGLQHQAAHRREIGGLSEKPAAEREIGPFADQRLGETGNIRYAVLAVGIERHHELRRVRQRVVDAGLQRGALAEVEWMSDHDRAGRVRVIGRGVGGAVVDHDHRIARTPDLAHDAGKNGPFIVGRDDHTHLRPRYMFHLTLPRYGTHRNSARLRKFRWHSSARRRRRGAIPSDATQ